MAIPAAQIIGTLLGSSAAAPITALGDAISKLYTTDDERLSKQALLERITQNLPLAQAEISKTEAASLNWFVAGGRPAIIWVCALALFCFYIPFFLISAILWAKICFSTGTLPPYPINPSDLIALITTLLGAATLRTVEKVNGVSR